MMSQRDIENLHFILNSTPESLEEWYAQADSDDIEYAQELMDAYSKELSLFQHTLEYFEDSVTDTSQAKLLLNNIFHP